MNNPLRLAVITVLRIFSRTSAATHCLSPENPTTNLARPPARRLFFLAIGALASLLATAPVKAQVMPPDGTYYGKTYGQWVEALFQYAFSLPTSHNPLTDTAEASAGQSGSVWFLGAPPVHVVGEVVVRSATIPGGKALFFPIYGVWTDNTDCDGDQRISDEFGEAQLRYWVTTFADSVHDLRCTIDGSAVPGLADATTTAYRVQSSTPGGFSYTLSGEDNWLSSLLGLSCWTNNTGEPITVDASIYHPVADGYYLLVAPFAPGPHTIDWYFEFGSPVTFSQEVSYSLTVLPPMLSVAWQGTNIVISWPQMASSNVLETTSSLHPTSWSSVDATNQALGDGYQVTLPVGGSNQFFRLRQSP